MLISHDSFAAAQYRWDGADPSVSLSSSRSIEARIAQREASIYADECQLVEIMSINDVRDEIDVETLALRAIRAWPYIEKLAAGIALSAAEAAAFPALFQQLKPIINRLDVIVREVAERYEGIYP